MTGLICFILSKRDKRDEAQFLAKLKKILQEGFRAHLNF